MVWKVAVGLGQVRLDEAGQGQAVAVRPGQARWRVRARLGKAVEV